MRRSTSLLIVVISAVGFVAHAIAAAGAAAHGHDVHGLYKAVARNNSPQTEGVDGKFDFHADGTFTFTRKTMETTLVTKGAYTEDSTKVTLRKAKGKSPWPEFWQNPAIMTIDTNGDLEMNGLTYEASLIGKAFEPGLYLCAAAPINHYYFSSVGGYKYKGQAMSTGEYWVEKSSDPDSGQETVRLVLNILRIDGKRVNFHQMISMDDDGGFTLEKKYKYHRVGEAPQPSGQR